MKNSNKEDISILMKQHGLQKRKNIKKERLHKNKYKVTHYGEAFWRMYTEIQKEYKKFNIRITFLRRHTKCWCWYGKYTSIQKRNFKKEEFYERLHAKEATNGTLFRGIYILYKGTQAVRTCEWK